MSTPVERHEVTEYIKLYASQAAHGNAHAERYLLSIMRATRLADDLADGDIADPARRAEATAELVDCLLIQIPTNPFFIASADLLTGVHLACLNAWRQSNRWWNGARGRHEYANVWRDQILDVFAIVARLTGHPDPAELNESVRECLKKNEPLPLPDRAHVDQPPEPEPAAVDSGLSEQERVVWVCGNCGREHWRDVTCGQCGSATHPIRPNRTAFPLSGEECRVPCPTPPQVLALLASHPEPEPEPVFGKPYVIGYQCNGCGRWDACSGPCRKCGAQTVKFHVDPVQWKTRKAAQDQKP